MSDINPVNQRFQLLAENDQIQNFLRRHGLTTHGRVPLRQRELEQRLRQIDEQSAIDLIMQSLVEKALDIKRPLRKIYQDSNQSKNRNPYVPIYENSCAITMVYCGSKINRNDTVYTFKIASDEVLVMQYPTSTNSIIVYKSFLKPNDSFTFKSHRLPDTPFTIGIYVNGVVDSRISTCCEHGFFKQRYTLSKRSAFQLLSNDGGIPCYTCQANDLMDDSIISDNEEDRSEWISTVELDQVTPSTSIRTTSIPSESSRKIDTKRKEYIKSKPVPSNNTSTGSDILSPMHSKQLIHTVPLKTKANEIQTSANAEKMVDNDETDKDLKSKDKAVSTVNQIRVTTDESTSKQKKSMHDKLANDETEERQEMISPRANHEMLQLLSKYLALLFPSPKSQTDDITSVPTSNHQHSAESYSTASPDLSQRENVETFVLIWLDASIDMNEDTTNCHTKLRAIVNSLVTFRTIDDTIHFIRNVRREKVFLIISGALAGSLIDRTEIHGLSQLDSIYIFCQNASKYRLVMEREHKIRGVFTDINRLCTRLKDDLKQLSNDLLPISVASGMISKGRSMTNKPRQEKQVIFLCAQLHRELLFTMEYPDNARLELVEFCKNIYADNETEREFIEELKTDYHAGNAVWWYTRPTFLSKMLNAALFRQDIPILYKFHFFINDLHTQLEQLHSLYKSSLESRTFTVYRGCRMSKKVFDETIRQEVNHLLAFDTFLSTSLHKEVALNFARNKSNNDDESILLEIEIDAEKLARPFADISRSSAFACEDEILFSIGTVFRIEHVAEEKTNDGVWLVRLVSIDENDEQLKNEMKQIRFILLNFFKRVCQAQIKRGNLREITTSYINIARIYYKQNDYQKSLEFYYKALETLLKLPSPDPLTIATYRNYIAMVYMALGQQDQAKHFYEKVLKTRIKCCQSNDPLLIDTLHTIGDIYHERREFNKALKQYEKALEMQPISIEHDPSSIAATHIKIALVYRQQNKIEDALDHFLQALNYQRQSLSEYHPFLAFLYNNIGTMYYRLKNYPLALQNQLITLQIEQRSLPQDHKAFAVTYSNIATSYEQMKNYSQAIEYADRAARQVRLHFNDDHPDVQTKQAYLDRLLMNKDNNNME